MLRVGKSIFLSLILSLGIILPCLAEVAAKDQIFTIDDFSKGLATRQSPLSLPKGYATVSENIHYDTENGSLTKRDRRLLYGTADASEPITGAFRLYLADGTKSLVVSHGDEIEAGNDNTGAFTKILDLSSGNYRWQFLTWHNILIGTDGYNQPIKWDGTSASATYLGSCLGTDAGSGAGPDGTYTYKVSFYTSSYECVLDVPSAPVTVTDNDINLTMIPIGPDTYLGEDVIGRKIYRILNGGTTYRLLTNGTIANNTATTLTDSDADAAISGTTAYPTVNYTTVFSGQPPKGRFPLVHSNRLWLANNPTYPSRIFYSDDACPDFFQPDAYYNVRENDGDSITSIKNLLGILTVFKDNTIQKIYTDGDDPDADWSISDPFSFVGCKAPYTVVNTLEGIIYLSYGGLYKFNGQNSVLISDNITPTINDILESNFANCWAEYYKNTYYLAYPSKFIGVSTNNRILSYNLINKSFSIDLIDANVLFAFNSGTDWDVLYSGDSTTGKVYAHKYSSYEVRHSKHSDFAGTWDDAGYIPTGTPGGDANSPVIELRWTETIDDLTSTIDSYTTEIIDRPDTDGTYISPVMDLGASSFDKLYWNVNNNIYGSVSLYIRSGATAVACAGAAWSSAFTDPSGSDISGVAAAQYVQYKIALSTTDIAYSPFLYKNNGYVVRLTYLKEASTVETTIPINWTSGWIDFAPGYQKTLKKIDVYYESESSGILNLLFSNYEGDTDSFAIDLSKYPNHYAEYFTNGKFLGELFSLNINNSDLKSLKIRRISVIYDVEPLL